MTPLLRASVPFVLLTQWIANTSPALGDAGVTYTIPAEEALNGPKVAAPNHILDPSQREAGIAVDAAKVLGRVNPLVFGACFEDLNHQIYGGFYAQMIYGESFEEGPEKELPSGWRLHADWLKIRTWQGMWCAENDSIGMTGFRWYRMLWDGARFEDGVIECELMQPAFDPGRPIGLMFRAGGEEFRDACAVMLDTGRQVLELRIKEHAVATAPVACKPDEWLALRGEALGKQIRVFAGAKLVIEHSATKVPGAGLVGFDATESRGWFRNLKIETGGATRTPTLAPVRPSGYRGPVSQWWDAVVTGDADAAFAWDAGRPFNTLRSQKIEHRGGTGTAGIANRGLHRFGLSVAKGKTYQGRLYLRGEGEVTVALQSEDGSHTYATRRLTGIGTDWKKFPFDLTSDAIDHRARFVVSLDAPGAVWVDQVVLMPTGDALFKDLPVRGDLAELVIDSGVACIRMGGDYSNPPGFRWKTMLGDPDLRPQYNSCWYPFETRGWGVMEFIEFCRAAGIEPIPCLNHEETPEDVAELVRRYQLKYVQLGNGFAGVERTAAVADAIHKVAPEAKLLSGSIGHFPDVLPDAALLREMKEKLGGKAHAMAAFPYNFEVTGHASWQAMLDRLETLRGTLKIYSQEVNGGNHNLLRGLADAAFHNVTERNAAFVDIVTYCGMLQADGTAGDNGWDQGRIHFNNHRAWLQPHGWALRMAREHYQPLAVETQTRAPRITFKDPIPYGVPAVDALVASAARDESGKTLALKVVNFAPFPMKTSITIKGLGEMSSNANIIYLTGPGLDMRNTAENPDAVKPVIATRDGIGPEFSHLFPAYSYTILSIATLPNQPPQ